MGLGAFIGRMFGTEKAVETAVNGVVSGFDKLIYTKEEKAEDERKTVTQAREVMLRWFENSQGQNVARRVLAFLIAGTWLFMYLASFVVSLLAIWASTDVIAARMQATAAVTGGYADGMTGAMMLIIGFYFAAPHLSKIVEPALARFAAPRPPVLTKVEGEKQGA